MRITKRLKSLERYVISNQLKIFFFFGVVAISPLFFATYFSIIRTKNYYCLFMKEYGTDLLQQYKKLKQSEASLIGRIRKRNQFLIKNAGDEVLNKTMLNLQFDSKDVALLLDQIIAIEKAYAEQSKQLDMFDE
jgi:hypothetical protein